MRFFLALCVSGVLQAQVDTKAIHTWRQAHEKEILREFIPLIEIPNRANDQANIRRNADTILSMMKQRGIATRLLELEGAPPVVFGDRKSVV